MKVPLFNLNNSKDVEKLYLKKVEQLLKSKDWILGKEVEIFEENFSNFIGTKYCVGVNSGTDALELSLKSLGIKEKDEVIVPGYSFFATSEVVLKLGAKPVYCDISREDLNIDPTKVEDLITKKTRAIIPVHLFGGSANLNLLNNIAKKHGLFLIEDVAQAFGSKLNNKKLGSFGKTGCFSFYPTKNLGAFGDGGAITINDKKTYEKIKILRNHGQTEKYFHEYVGYNSRLDSIQACILNLKLKNIEKELKIKKSVVEMYSDAFNNVDNINILIKDFQPMNLLPVALSEGVSLNKVKKELKINEIGFGNYYPYGLHEFKISKHNPKKVLKNIEWAKNKVFTLPVHSLINKKKVNYIADIVQSSIN